MSTIRTWRRSWSPNMPTNQDGQHPGEYPAASGDIGTYPQPASGGEEAGYEMTDANVGGVAAFLGGLFAFVLVFFFFCYLMGRVINSGIEKQDGPVDEWHKQTQIYAGAKTGRGNLENLKSNAAIDQQQLQIMSAQFPGPRLQTDDGNQDTADLHAREDLLLNHYSSVPGQPLRIPIDQAMQLIAQRGLPVMPQNGQQAPELAFDGVPGVTRPLTNGFARTGPELDSMQARQQKLDFGKAEAAEHAELAPPK
jgi:hypothetical protein